MKKPFIRLAVFVVVCCLSAFIGWLTGYNFDERNVGVAVWAAFTAYIGFIVAVPIMDM